MTTLVIIAIALVLVAINAYAIVNAYQRTKNPKKWEEFLDDAGVKLD